MLEPSVHLLQRPFSRTSTRNLRTLCPSWTGSASRMTSNAAGSGNFNARQGFLSSGAAAQYVARFRSRTCSGPCPFHEEEESARAPEAKLREYSSFSSARKPAKDFLSSS